MAATAIVGRTNVNSYIQISILGILLIALLMHSVQINSLQRELKDLKGRLRKIDSSALREPVLNI